MRHHRVTVGLAAALLLLAAAGCGDDDDSGVTSGESGDGATSACLEGSAECDDVPGDAVDAPAPPPGDASPDEPVSSPAAGACLEGSTECNDTPGDVGPPGDPGDGVDVEAEREEARGLLGVAEPDLAETVRVARRGADTFPLTEDYVIGRDTVELDDDGSGVFVVTSVTVELPEGPETFVAE